LISFFGVPVDIGTMMTASIAMGIGVDGTLHKLTWFRKGIEDGKSREDSIALAVGHSGPAIWETSAVLALGMLGMVLASVFVLYRYANALTNVLAYPIWLGTGILVPVTLLPGWVEPISWLLPSTWAARAIRETMLGGRPLLAIGACLALAVVYLGLALFTLGHFETLARRRASLALA